MSFFQIEAQNSAQCKKTECIEKPERVGAHVVTGVRTATATKEKSDSSYLAISSLKFLSLSFSSAALTPLRISVALEYGWTYGQLGN
jgi:hypothetical protein